MLLVESSGFCHLNFESLIFNCQKLNKEIFQIFIMNFTLKYSKNGILVPSGDSTLQISLKKSCAPRSGSQKHSGTALNNSYN